MQGADRAITTPSIRNPSAPAEVRGEFETIPTTLPGVLFAEHLPDWQGRPISSSIIRGHDPKNGSHGTADHQDVRP